MSRVAKSKLAPGECGAGEFLLPFSNGGRRRAESEEDEDDRRDLISPKAGFTCLLSRTPLAQGHSHRLFEPAFFSTSLSEPSSHYSAKAAAPFFTLTLSLLQTKFEASGGSGNKKKPGKLCLERVYLTREKKKMRHVGFFFKRIK